MYKIAEGIAEFCVHVPLISDAVQARACTSWMVSIVRVRVAHMLHIQGSEEHLFIRIAFACVPFVSCLFIHGHISSDTAISQYVNAE